jgi:hypothetical protein
LRTARAGGFFPRAAAGLRLDLAGLKVVLRDEPARLRQPVRQGCSMP